MPIYEYECQACEHRFEEWQKMSDEPIRVCPQCQATKVEKLISHSSFQLKGGGWYSDLYSSAKPSPSGGSSASPVATSTTTASGGGSTTAASAGSSTPSPSGDNKGSGKNGVKAA